MLRSPIIAVVGHVDHGKTTLLDCIRQTSVTAKEPGMITQTISTTFVPRAVLTGLCSGMMKRFGFEINMPGLLFIDTPGHAAFTTMRQRGGSIADIAVLVIDINEGLMPQTIESIEILRSFRTPFVIALNKIDRIEGWSSAPACFIDNVTLQDKKTQSEFDKKFYDIVGQLAQHGFSAERFDRITDFSKTIAMIPVSAKTGEGVPDLLIVIAGIADKFLKNQLVTTTEAKGTILEVKEVTGMGTTIDVIVYDGTIEKGDFLIIGGAAPKITRIKALLEPKPMKDMRTEKEFISIGSCAAAIGVKIVATGLKEIVAGLPVRTAKSAGDCDRIANEMKEYAKKVEIEKPDEGILLKADTVGSLEAMIKIFENYPVKEAKIGNINKHDVISADANRDALKRSILGFNVQASDEAEAMAKERKVKIIISDIIYRLIEEYGKWTEEMKEEMKREELKEVIRPGKIKILPGCVFRASNPAIVGCEILSGKVMPKSGLFKVYKDRVVEVGAIKQIQKEGMDISEAKISDKVAISITGPTVGRQIRESDELYTNISESDYRKLKKFEDMLTNTEKQALEEIADIRRRAKPAWGM